VKVPEAAKMLAISRSALYEMINKRQVGIVRFGSSIRIPVKEIDRVMTENLVAPLMR
jgi:excisionase family DNA binding protein